MNQRMLLNVGLLAAVAVLTTVVLMQEKEAPEAPAVPVTSLTAAQVTAIAIRPADGEPVELVKEGDGWRLRAPRPLAANPLRAELVARAAEAPSLRRLETAEPAKFGLAPPRATLTLNGTVLEFGDTDPLNQRRYLRTGGAIHLVEDTVYPLLTQHWSRYVDLALLPAGGRILAARFPDKDIIAVGDTWQVSRGMEGLSADAPVAFMEGWMRAKAMEVLPYEGDGEQEQVILRLEGDEGPIAFHIVRREPRLELARPDLGLVYLMADGETLLDLPKPAPAH